MFSILLSLTPALQAPSPFRIESANGRVTSLRAAGDTLNTEYLASGAALGDVHVATRKGGGAWQAQEAHDLAVDPNGTGASWRAGDDVEVHSGFERQGDRLVWRFRLTNRASVPVEVGDLSTPLPMRTRADKDSKAFVLKHSFVSGAGSFLFWMRPDSRGPYLTITPLRGTSPEYWARGGGPYAVYVHSAAEAPKVAENKGSWRLPRTSRTLKPGESAEYGYAFSWSKDYAGVRDAVAQAGGLDVQVAPGMTVPRDLYADVAIRSSRAIEGIDAEFPQATTIRLLGARGGYRIYRVKFGKLGENRLTVRQAGSAKTYLEFFSCLPVETLIAKRAAFLTAAQVKDPSKWYDGLLREWNMDNGKYLSPDEYDRIKGWRIYEVTCDDPGLGKPAFLASKNAEHPVQAEVTALDRYIDKFVWGGLQQTTMEPYPCSIYGIPDWKTLRESKEADKTKGVAHVWRCYDYPHVVLMYHSMYRVAAQNPAIKTQLSAKAYLQRAYGTAHAMFTIPAQLAHWSAYGTGFYNEVVLPNLIADLRGNGMAKEADEIAGFWARKVKNFVAGRVDLFQSEYAFDSTGFESTEAIADNAMQDKSLGLDAPRARGFLDRQMAANLFCRGVVEPAYYLLGSDYRGGGGDGYTLSYMAPMGGWGVLHYALNYAKDPAPYLRLGYQSILSSWALTNAGDAASNYGYWYPGKPNDGGAGGGFEPAAYGKTWLDQPNGRGSWYYSCETDLGYCGYLRAARTTVADDPIFGRTCFAGTGASSGSVYRFVPKDGVRRRVSIRTKGVKLDVESTGAHLLDGTLDEKTGRLTLRLESSASPQATLTVVGGTARLPGTGGVYKLGSARTVVVEAKG